MLSSQSLQFVVIVFMGLSDTCISIFPVLFEGCHTVLDKDQIVGPQFSINPPHCLMKMKCPCVYIECISGLLCKHCPFTQDLLDPLFYS